MFTDSMAIDIILMYDNLEKLQTYLNRYPLLVTSVLDKTCFYNSKKCLKWMLTKFDIPDKTSVFYSALCNRRWDIATYLFKYKHQINFISNGAGVHILYSAIDHVVILKRIIDEGCTLNRYSSDMICSKCTNNDSIIILLQHDLIHIHENTPQPIQHLQDRVAKSKRACVSATIALLQILRVNRVPKDLSRHVAQSFFMIHHRGESWFE